MEKYLWYKLALCFLLYLQAPGKTATQTIQLGIVATGCQSHSSLELVAEENHAGALEFLSRLRPC